MSPYGNHMDIGVSMKLEGDSALDAFVCKVIIDGLFALAMALMPEFAGAEVGEDIELEALCDELGNQSAKKKIAAANTQRRSFFQRLRL